MQKIHSLQLKEALDIVKCERDSWHHSNYHLTHTVSHIHV